MPGEDKRTSRFLLHTTTVTKSHYDNHTNYPYMCGKIPIMRRL